MKTYLQKKDYDIDDGLFFLPGKSASKIPIIASLAESWAVKYLIILDNDPEGDIAINTLEKDYLIDVSKKVIRSGEKGDSVEDLFSEEEFDKYVLGKKLT